MDDIVRALCGRGLDEALRVALRKEFLRSEYSADPGEWAATGDGREKGGFIAAAERVMRESPAALDAENFVFQRMCDGVATGGRPVGARLGEVPAPDPVPGIDARRRAWSASLFSRLQTVVASSGNPFTCPRVHEKKREGAPVAAADSSVLFDEARLLEEVCAAGPPPAALPALRLIGCPGAVPVCAGRAHQHARAFCLEWVVIDVVGCLGAMWLSGGSMCGLSCMNWFSICSRRMGCDVI